MTKVNIKKLHPNAIIPRYMTSFAAGVDLHAAIETPVLVRPGERALIPTGLAMEIPPGFEGQVRPRSGLALKHGIALVNAPGTIDADYRGEVQVIVINHGQETVQFTSGDRIAQLIIAPVSQVDFAEIDDLSSSGRGAGGFGHTGFARDKKDAS